MVKQELQFAVVTKGNKVTAIGRSQVLQPEVKFRGGVSNGLMIQSWPGKAAGHERHRQNYGGSSKDQRKNAIVSMTGEISNRRSIDMIYGFVHRLYREGRAMEKKDRDSIAMEIANELLDNEILDENNFSHDTGALLQCIGFELQDTVEEHSGELMDCISEINRAYYKNGMKAGAVLLLQLMGF